PSATCRSVRQTPQVLIRTRISPGPGAGSGNSIACNGAVSIGAGAYTAIAFIESPNGTRAEGSPADGLRYLQFEVGFFQNSRSAEQKTITQHAVDHPMVIRERQVHHGADRKRILAIRFDHHRALLDLAHAQDADLRLVDNRESEQVSLAAGIG